MSDIQLVISHAVTPKDCIAEYVVRPKPPPCTVTLADPVLARLAIISTLSDGASTDTATLTLPVRAPAVMARRAVAVTPWLVWHRAEVSDSQVVLSQAEPAKIDDTV